MIVEKSNGVGGPRYILMHDKQFRQHAQIRVPAQCTYVGICVPQMKTHRFNNV